MKLEVKNVSKHFGNNHVLDDINIYLNDGEIVSILGASGGGKTTLFNIISGLMIPDAGNVLLNEEEVTGMSGRISYMLQKDMMLPYKTIADNVALPLMIKKDGSSIFGKKKRARKEACKYFKEFGIEGCENMYPGQISGGMRQRAALLRTYLFSKDVALLDEPFSALDTITRSSMHQWYLSIMEQIKLSTLFITHDVDEAVILSDRIYILAGHPGRVVKEITVNKEKPRSKDFILTSEFMEYKKQIVSLIG